MKYLKALFNFLLTILTVILYKWIPNLTAVIKLWRELLARWCAEKTLPKRLRKASVEQCIKISNPAFKRPDPMIYSQGYLMQQGLAVTWDNPDIELRQGGITVPSHSLKADTEYEIVARIWNNSTEAPVVGLPVQFSYLSFGVGTKQHSIGQTQVNLGVKGGANHPAFATAKWRTPATSGHYCIQVLLDWLDDINPNNNLGQENTDVSVAHSPAEFTFQLRNYTLKRQTYRFEVDTYIVPPLTPCSQFQGDDPLRERPEGTVALRQAPGTIASVPSQHQRHNYPLPPNWTISFVPEQPLLSPDEEITIKAIVVPPDSFKGRQLINVHTFYQDGLAGGVTISIENL
jgi:hypothetical protein